MTQKVLGPTGGRRRKRLAIFMPFLAIVALILAIGGSAANSTLVNFEIDGNLEADGFGDGTALGADWINLVDDTGTADLAALMCPSNASSCLPSAVVDGPALGTGTLFRDPLKVDPDPTTFTQGDKENDFTNVLCPAGQPCTSDTPWHIVSGTVPPQKDDLFDIATNAYISGNQAELDLGMLRTNNNGSSHVDFELNKLSWTPGSTDGVTCAGEKTGIANFKCPRRTEGDFLVSFEISPSSTTPPVSVFTRFFVWDLPGGTDANGHGRGNVNCEGPLTGNENTCPWEEIAPSGNPVITAANAAEIPAGPWGSRLPDGSATSVIPPGGWFEAALDLDQIGFAPSCPGFATASAKSRSSGSSVTAALTDLAGPFPVNLTSCGQFKIIKTGKDARCTAEGFRGTTPDANCVSAGNRRLPGATFSVTGPNSFSATPQTGSDGTVCLTDLQSGSYSVTETGAPTGYKADSSSATSVSVTTSDTCATKSVTFTNTPLSTIQVKFTSLAGAGVTTSQIVCKQGATVIAANTENGSDDNEGAPVRDDTDETFGNGTSTLVPGVYDCRIDIDP